MKTRLSTNFLPEKLFLGIIGLFILFLLRAELANGYEDSGTSTMILVRLGMIGAIAWFFYWAYKRPRVSFDQDFLYIRKAGQEEEQIPLASVMQLNMKVSLIQKPRIYRYEIVYDSATGIRESVIFYFKNSSLKLFRVFTEQVKQANSELYVKDWAHSMEKWFK